MYGTRKTRITFSLLLVFVRITISILIITIFCSDEVILKIIVDPEGVPVQEHKSMLLCGKGSYFFGL